jgi:hypothetical protein
VTRRRFLAGGGAVAGAILLGGCGDGGSGAANTTTGPEGLALVQFFGGLPMLAAGGEVRAPFGVADVDGLLPTDSTPERLAVSLLDPDGTTVAEITVSRHAAGLPRGYFPLRFTADAAGIYTARTEVAGEVVEMAIKVDPPKDVTVIKAGEPMPAIETPTVDDLRGVDPLCTNDPACALHDITLAEALTGGPVAFLVATPAFCQTAICGPVLDVLLSQVDANPSIRFLHAEVYEDPATSLDAQTAAVTELGLVFEPCLVLVGADGAVVERLDTIFDEVELAEALARLT